MNFRILFASVLVFSASISAAALGADQTDLVVTWLDLSDWKSIEHGEQRFFEDVFGETDLVVTAIGSFPFGNSVTASGFINSGHETPHQSHSFRFDLTNSHQLITEFETLDNEELVRVHYPGAEQWDLVSGSAPVVSPFGSGLQFQGVATGFGNPGVSNFVSFSEKDVSRLTVAHQSLAFAPKFETFRVGVINTVPEPSFPMIVVPLALAMIFRRKK